MKNIKRYKELFESQTELTPEQIKWLDECTRGSWSLNPQTGLVDVRGSFVCNGQNLTDFKGVGFGVVTKHFDCHNNDLTSLKGAPQSVVLQFDCTRNELTSLEGAPQEVGGSFFCYSNELVSLKDAPREVGASFDCSNNKLPSLEDAPQEVGGYFDCSNNKLTSLKGAPTSVRGAFHCSLNPVSASVLKDLYRKVRSGMSWEEAVEMHWDYIDNERDEILLAQYNPNFGEEDKEYYRVLGKMDRFNRRAI